MTQLAHLLRPLTHPIYSMPISLTETQDDVTKIALGALGTAAAAFLAGIPAAVTTATFYLLCNAKWVVDLTNRKTQGLEKDSIIEFAAKVSILGLGTLGCYGAHPIGALVYGSIVTCLFIWQNPSVLTGLLRSIKQATESLSRYCISVIETPKGFASSIHFASLIFGNLAALAVSKEAAILFTTTYISSMVLWDLGALLVGIHQKIQSNRKPQEPRPLTKEEEQQQTIEAFLSRLEQQQQITQDLLSIVTSLEKQRTNLITPEQLAQAVQAQQQQIDAIAEARRLEAPQRRNNQQQLQELQQAVNDLRTSMGTLQGEQQQAIGALAEGFEALTQRDTAAAEAQQARPTQQQFDALQDLTTSLSGAINTLQDEVNAIIQARRQEAEERPDAAAAEAPQARPTQQQFDRLQQAVQALSQRLAQLSSNAPDAFREHSQAHSNSSNRGRGGGHARRGRPRRGRGKGSKPAK